MKVDVLTLFPSMFGGFFSESIARIARESGVLDARIWNIREFAEGRHRSVDDRPYGGGPGMVMRVEPVFGCVEHVLAERGADAKKLLLTPQGRRLDQARVRELALEPHLLLLCGHYEGFDERIRTGLAMEEVSIGDFVLTGGELPAMVLVDAVMRLLPGALGSAASPDEETFSEPDWIEYPQYTRPAEFRGMRIPEVLLSGNHENIRKWRQKMAERRAVARRAEERTDEKARRPGARVHEGGHPSVPDRRHGRREGVDRGDG